MVNRMSREIYAYAFLDLKGVIKGWFLEQLNVLEARTILGRCGVRSLFFSVFDLRG